MLKTLEDKKWIRREANFKDKRVVKIFLTELGKKKRDQARQGVILFNEIVYERLGQEKLDHFFEVMESINSLLDEDTVKILEKLNHKM
jgi:DNA-binding MarR family transcriptional regulator